MSKRNQSSENIATIRGEPQKLYSRMGKATESSFIILKTTQPKVGEVPIQMADKALTMLKKTMPDINADDALSKTMRIFLDDASYTRYQLKQNMTKNIKMRLMHSAQFVATKKPQNEED